MPAECLFTQQWLVPRLLRPLRAATAPCGSCAPCARLLLPAAAASLARGFCPVRPLRAHARGCCSPRLLRAYARGCCFPRLLRAHARGCCSLPLLRAHARSGCTRPAAAAFFLARRLLPFSYRCCALTRAAADLFPAAAARSRALRLHPTCGCCALTRAAAALLTPAENYLRPSSLSRVSLSGPHVWGNGITSHAFSLTPHTHSLTNTNDIRSLMRAAGGPRLRERRRGSRSVEKPAGAPSNARS